jgi:hypothetical protein
VLFFGPLTFLYGPHVVWHLWFDVVSSTSIFLYCRRVDKNKHVMLSSAISVASGTFSFTEVILSQSIDFKPFVAKLLDVNGGHGGVFFNLMSILNFFSLIVWM